MTIKELNDLYKLNLLTEELETVCLYKNDNMAPAVNDGMINNPDIAYKAIKKINDIKDKLKTPEQCLFKLKSMLSDYLGQCKQDDNKEKIIKKRNR